jgi:hypothetical protein
VDSRWRSPPAPIGLTSAHFLAHAQTLEVLQPQAVTQPQVVASQELQVQAVESVLLVFMAGTSSESRVVQW